jgi:hypothetical protein
MSLNRFAASHRSALRAYQARISITQPTVRGQGEGVLAALHHFLAFDFQLGGMRTTTERSYIKRLDRATEALQRALGRKSGSFGLARKLLNIYMRDCFYSRLLCSKYRLESIEPFLEVPLDSFVATGLIAEAERLGQFRRLPTWRTIKGLEREESDRLQSFASELAATRKHDRVHLDVTLWGSRKS